MFPRRRRYIGYILIMKSKLLFTCFHHLQICRRVNNSELSPQDNFITAAKRARPQITPNHFEMPPSDFATANIDEIVEKLTTDEAILLTAGVGFWHTHAIERLGVPAVKVCSVFTLDNIRE